MYPTSVDWEKAVNTNQHDVGIKADNRAFQIGKALKKMPKKVPTQVKIYDFFALKSSAQTPGPR